MNIGKNLKNMRKEIRLTQKQLAEKLNVQTITVRKWESGEHEPSISKLDQLSDIFECPIDKIIYGSIGDYSTDLIDEMFAELHGEIMLEEKRLLSETQDPSRIVYEKGYLDGLKMALVILEEV